MRLKTIATFGIGKTEIGGIAEPCVSLNIAQGSVIDFKAPAGRKPVGKCIDNKVGKGKPSEPTKVNIAKLAAQISAERAKIALSSVKGTKSSKVHDSQTRVGAIVNAANERCLGGGGVDRAINNAGGPRLWMDREALPLLSEHEVRCHTGGAVVTGPNRYGYLNVNYVIHAVGPCYFKFSNHDEDDSEEDSNMDSDKDQGDEFVEPDSLLRSAYMESLERCRENGITDVAFSLLSAGVFRGKRSLHDVLRIGVLAIRDWIAEAQKAGSNLPSCDDGEGGIQTSSSRLQSVTLCGFSKSEVEELMEVCRLVFESKEEEQN